jgi:fatty-acyl-CoA synthase
MAGSPCPVKVMQDVVDKMNMKEISIVFGQTEASPGCTQSRVDDSIEIRVNTVGRALPGVECKIVDPQTGKDLPDNVDGEFVARGYNIMKGYYKMPEATAAAIDENGWLHRVIWQSATRTGATKLRTYQGYDYSRRRETFTLRKLKILYITSQVKDVQVIGVPDKQYGEEIMACVILKDNETLTADDSKITSFSLGEAQNSALLLILLQNFQ